ncbi:MAG: hypothetical protein IJ842_06395 [Bacilli bacterium]|nr:hypothetical protein [Bacilli bacterium]
MGLNDMTYYKSNENLKDLFNSFSVLDKDVLSVLSSSDHLLYSYYYGASNVDSFDINEFTKYYFYMRKWGLLYNNDYYPKKSLFTSYNKYFEKLLDKVDTIYDKEFEARDFWYLYLDRLKKSGNKMILNDYVYPYDNVIRDTNRLTSILKDKELTFYNVNMCDDVSSIRKKYDVIIMSNILEYYSIDHKSLVGFRDNLYGLLKDDGKVICSNLIKCNDDFDKIIERKVFNELFEYKNLNESYSYYTDSYTPVGYQYIKK